MSIALIISIIVIIIIIILISSVVFISGNNGKVIKHLNSGKYVYATKDKAVIVSDKNKATRFKIIDKGNNLYAFKNPDTGLYLRLEFTGGSFGYNMFLGGYGGETTLWNINNNNIMHSGYGQDYSEWDFEGLRVGVDDRNRVHAAGPDNTNLNSRFALVD